MENDQKKRRNENIANRRLFRRTIVLMVLCGVVMFVPLVGRLWNLQIVQHDELTEKAVDQQTGTLAVSAARGTIYDSRNNVLAISSTAYDIIISPRAIVERQTKLDEAGEQINVEDLVVNGMAEILGLDPQSIRDKCRDSNSQYKRLARKVDAETEEAVRAYIEEHKLTSCIYLQADTKRYYPYSTLASQIIGFTNDNGGAYGLEASWDEELTGEDGLIVTAQNGKGTDLLNFFQDYYDAEDGDDLHLTLDANIQSLCERYLKEGIERYEIKDGGCIIVMDCDSGAILGMASYPEYDLNQWNTVLDTGLLNSLEKEADKLVNKHITSLADKLLQEEPGLTEDEARSRVTEQAEKNAATEAYSNALATQWRNKAINDTYEPGSTFKTVVLAAALEEGVTTPNEVFNCTGSIKVYDWDIDCSAKSGHGYQDLARAVGNSCNPVFITLGQRLGSQTFWSYLQAFGIVDAQGNGTSTGVDLPGEGRSLLWQYDDFGPVELATASFGQRFNVTPIQLIAAANAVINGGYYYQPYVVDYVESADGTVTYTADTAPLRQVISSSTSAACRDMLEGVVANGLTGKNAYRAGYRIGGKTGTSETLVDYEYVVSFLGFAPADDPEIVALVIFDTPAYASGSNMSTPGGQYISGGNMAAPIAGDLIADVLDYMDYGKQYTAAEMAGADTLVPYLTGFDVKYATALAKEKGFTVRVVGGGDSSSEVKFQTAKGGGYLPKGSELVLYVGDAQPPEEVTVPDLIGMTPEQVRDALAGTGLYMKATGASQYYTEQTKVYAQSEDPGTAVRPGTVLTVSFNDTSDRDSEVGVIND